MTRTALVTPSCSPFPPNKAEHRALDPATWHPLASEVDSRVQGIHLGIHPSSYCYCVIIRRSGGGFHSGWTPKKTDLTLAKCRAAPPSIRRCSGRNRKINGLAEGGESFSGQPVTVCPRKTVSPARSEKVFDGANDRRLPPRTRLSEPSPHCSWTPAGFRGPPWGPLRRQRGEPSSNALSPS